MASAKAKALSLLGVIVVGALAASRIAGTEELPSARLPVPKHLSRETRVELSRRMAHHGETMSRLVRSVVLLDRERTAVLARDIAEEEFGRLAAKKSGLALPKEYDTEATRFGVAARALAVAAAESAEDKGLAEKFAVVTGICVTCHSAYLYGEPR